MLIEEFLDRVEALLVPAEYRKKLVHNLPLGWRVYRKGPYLFAAVPYDSVPAGDFRNFYVKTEIRKLVLAFPFFGEKGLYLLYYGSIGDWGPHWKDHQVDKTALRPVIVQAIHFVDPASGDNFNSRTAWGSIKFGFCDGVTDKIERLCVEIF